MTLAAMQKRFGSQTRLAWWQLLVHLAAWMPLVVLIWDGLHHHLTANPIQTITDRTGVTALVLLVLSLVCTPAGAIFGLKHAQKLRRPLGLYGFLYVTLHVLTFVVLDYGLDPQMILQAIRDNFYVLFGLAAFLLLLPLALTSTKASMKRLGKNWRRLHSLVYLAVPLVVVHNLLFVKADIRVPLQYATIIALLLILRVPPVRQFLVRLRYTVEGKARPRTIRPTEAAADANLKEAASR